MKTIPGFETKTDLDEIVLLQINKILMHPLFLCSRTLSRFLKFIVNESLAGRQNQIKEYTIATQVLNKPVNFTPAYDACVRVHARRLRDALFAYYGRQGSDDDCMITIPKGSYVPVFEIVDCKRMPKKTGSLSLYNTSDSKKNRIAFMPFKTYVRNISWTSFVDNLGEELTRQFSCRSELSVLSFHTARMLSPEKSKIKNLACSYGLQYLISGSSRIENSKIKVFVELIDAASETQVWSGVYYQTAEVTNYFSAIDKLTSEMMQDLTKIKYLECDDGDQITGISEDPKRRKTNILYLDRYIKNPNAARTVAGN